MMDHIPTERMHDLIDGLLAPREAVAVADHVESCPVCRQELELLRGTVEALRALPLEAKAPAGAWGGIERRIREAGAPTAAEATVLPFPGARARRRRLSFSVPQLAAAAMLVALLSGVAVWITLAGGTSVGTAPQLAAESSAAGAALRAASTRSAGYDAAIAELEVLVERGRDVLAPETMETLDAALATIDAAVADVRAALEGDPGSELLQSMLIDHRTAKIRLLRQAATAIDAQS